MLERYRIPADIARSSYYKWHRRFEETGALDDRSRARKNPPKLDARVITAIARCALDHPTWRAQRISTYLKGRRTLVSATAVRKQLHRQHLASEEVTKSLLAVFGLGLIS